MTVPWSGMMKPDSYARTTACTRSRVSTGRRSGRCRGIPKSWRGPGRPRV